MGNLALTLRAYAQTAPSLMRPHLAAAADQVEECARLRAELDEARDCIGFNAYRALESERDRISELHAASQAGIDRLRAERDAAQKQVAELTAARDSETLGTLGIVISTLRAERDAAQTAVIEQSRINNIWRQRAERAEAERSVALIVLRRCRTILTNMALENKSAIFKTRWPIKHEPLRADAKNLLPELAELLGVDDD